MIYKGLKVRFLNKGFVLRVYLCENLDYLQLTAAPSIDERLIDLLEKVLLDFPDFEFFRFETFKKGRALVFLKSN